MIMMDFSMKFYWNGRVPRYMQEDLETQKNLVTLSESYVIISSEILSKPNGS